MNQLATIPSWREIQRENFTSIEQLASFLDLSDSQQKQLFVPRSFPLNLPKRLANKIEKSTLNDPILKQFVPTKKELEISTKFKASPVCDEMFAKSPKLLKKYHGRALILATSACAMNCRFCFRQNYDYEKNKNFQHELELIANDDSIYEVILSGGDPLSLSDEVLATLVSNLEEIAHVKILRFHSRFLIGIPERVTQRLLSILKASRLQIYFVTHINHPVEIDLDVTLAIKSLQEGGACLLNHSVLLADVNDNIETLTRLCFSLVSIGIIPYYLNQLDPVQGTMHFEVAKEKGLGLVKQLRKFLPGYAVPTFIQEVPGMPSKTPLS